MCNLKRTIWKIVRTLFVQKANPFLRVGPVLAGLILLASGLTYAASTQPMYGGTLRVSTYTDGTAIGYPPDSYRGPVLGMAQAFPAIETLFRYDKEGRPVPWLATKVEEDARNKNLVITLRKGVKFHDGTDFNAEAVKWNIEQHMAARSPGTDKLRSIDVVDDYTARINFLEWDNRMTSSLAVQLGMMISPTAFKKNGKDWAANHPIGTGPFEFVSWEKDVRTTYKKFSGYWQKGKPYLDRIEWLPISEAFTRQNALRNGEVDVVLFPAASEIASFEREGFVVSRHKVGSGARGGVFDSANPKSPFANVKVRQAVQHAIDSAAIVKALYNGEGEPANQFAYKGHWGYNPSVVGYPYNPTKAKQLLAEAGFPNGFKTKLVCRAFPAGPAAFHCRSGIP